MPAQPPRETLELKSEHPIDKVEGTLERVTFHNEENGYTVARIMPEGGAGK